MILTNMTYSEQTRYKIIPTVSFHLHKIQPRHNESLVLKVKTALLLGICSYPLEDMWGRGILGFWSGCDSSSGCW